MPVATTPPYLATARLAASALVAALGLFAVASAPNAMAASKKKAVADNAERYFIHKAVKGDTLSGIAHRYLENKRDWKLLDRLNKVSDPDLIPVGQEIRIPQSAMRAESKGAEVIAVKGQAVANGRPIGSGSKLAEGDRVETPQDGFVSIRLADGSILKVQSQSAVRLERARILANTGGVSDAVVDLRNGRLETDVNKQKSGARYEVRTPSSNMGVRGTIFRAASSIDGKKSASEVVEGLVAVGGESGLGNPLSLAAGFGTVIEAGKPPAPPTALLPAPAFASTPLRVEADAPSVSVRPVPGAVAYRAQIGRDSEFKEVVASSSSASTTLSFPAVPTGSYHARVRAVDAQGLEGFDVVSQLRVMPASPQLVAAGGVAVSPKDAERVMTPSPRFVWDAVAGVTQYRLQVARDRAFSTFVIDELVPAATFTPSKSLLPGDYFWRVASVDGGEVARFSPTSAFAVGSDPLRLSAPTVEGSRVTVAWTGDGRDDAEVVIATDERFAKVVRTERATGGRLQLSDLPRGHYFVRVRPKFSERDGEWSVYEPFSVYTSGSSASSKQK